MPWVNSTGARLPSGPALEEAELGALFSLSAAVLAPAAAWLLRTGRYAEPLR